MKEAFTIASQIAEKHGHEMLPFLHQSRIFKFPGKAHEVFKDDPDCGPNPDPASIRFLFDTFFLPFKVCAIDDGTGVCIVVDLEDGEPVGLDKHRMFLNCEWVNSEFDDQFADGKSPEIQAQLKNRENIAPYTMAITCGSIHSARLSDDGRLEYQFGLAWTLLASPDKVYLPQMKLPGRMPNNEYDLLLRNTGRNVGVVLSEIYYFNRPGRFILEERPKKVRLASSFHRVVRPPDRPQYTILRPGEIRAKLGLNSPTSVGNEREPHERRRHFRTFHSDKFIHMKGKQIVIPATWIGASEAKVGNKTYKVMLDL